MTKAALYVDEYPVMLTYLQVFVYQMAASVVYLVLTCLIQVAMNDACSLFIFCYSRSFNFIHVHSRANTDC